MFIPATIQEFLDERIEFCKNNIKNIKNNHILLSDFHKALIDFEYCKKLYLHLSNNKDDVEYKTRFKRVMAAVISNAIFAMRQVEERCYFGIPTGEKSYTPQETQDDLSQLRGALDKIYHQVNAY